jgi:hypothetical protein
VCVQGEGGHASASVPESNSDDDDLILEVSSANMFASRRGEDEEEGQAAKKTHPRKAEKEAAAKRSERESGRHSPKNSRQGSARSGSDRSLVHTATLRQERQGGHCFASESLHSSQADCCVLMEFCCVL